MSKAHRGKGIRELFAQGRGVCPVCNRENVKVLYEQEAGGQKFKICKVCRAAVKNGKKKLPAVDIPPAAEAPVETPKAPAAAEPVVETAAAETKEVAAEEPAAAEVSEAASTEAAE